MNCVSITHISRLATQLTPMPILSLRLTGWRTSWLLSRTSSRPSPRSWTRPSQRCPDTKTTKIEKTTFYVVTDTKMAARIPNYQDDQLYWAQTLTLTVVVLTKFGHRKCFAAFFLHKYSRADFYQSDRCSVVLFVDDGLWGAQAVKNVFPSSSQTATWAYKAAGVQKWFFATFKICCLLFLLCKKD